MASFCTYYQAYIERAKVVEIIGILKSFDHICFDRSIDPATSLFEFFVPKDQEPIFLALMNYFTKQRTVHGLKELPNRLMYEELTTI
jgi:hypothetical protein